MNPQCKVCKHTDSTKYYYMMRNASNTHFLTLSLALTYLLDEMNVCPAILWGFNFQSVDPQWFKPIRE